MSNFFHIKLLLSCLFLAFLAACSSTSASNQGARLDTSARSDPLKANIEVKEVIRGRGCSGSFLMIFTTGDKKFLALSDMNTSTPEGKAKAAAAYDALYGKGGEITTDIIVNPVYQTDSNRSIFSSDVCVSVVGYRGVITSWDRK
jgi:hypothetical protein